MFSFRPIFFRRVISGVRVGTFRRCIQTKGFVSVCGNRTRCRSDMSQNKCMTRTFASEPVIVHCWKCKEKIKSIIFCEHCSTLQKPRKNTTYFDLFDMKADFDTDPVALSVKYRNLQSSLHPDKFANASEEEKIISAEYSSLINKAYQTLLLPLSRGMYLLELKGMSPTEDTMKDDKEFLMEVMIRNEELEAIESDMDIKAFHKDVKETLNELVHEVSDAFQKDNISKAHDALVRMRYFTSILEKVKTKIRERGIIE